MKLSLNRDQLKIIAILSMVIDHIAWGFVDFYSPLGQFMHVLGRFTIPIMCFFVAKGYRHTSNLKQYISRLFGFALFASIPFYIFFREEYGYRQNFFFDLLLGLLILCVVDGTYKKWQKVVLCIILFGASMVIGGWPILPACFILIFYYGKSFKDQVKWFVIADVSVVLFLVVAISLNTVYQFAPQYQWVWWDRFYQLGFILALPLLYCYNGERGHDIGGRYFFYAFYPAHFWVLVFIKYLMNRPDNHVLYIGVHIVALVIATLILALTAQCKPSEGQSSILVFVSAGMMYLLGFIAEIMSDTVNGYHHSIIIEYVGEMIMFVGLVQFVKVLCKTKIPQFLYSMHVVIAFLVIYGIYKTMDNQFFYKSIAMNTNGPFPRLELTYGPGFYMTIAYIILITLYCVAICVISYQRLSAIERKRLRLFIIGVFCCWSPYILKAMNLTGGYEIPGVGIIIAAVFFYLILIKYEFLDTVTLASEKALEESQEGILVLNDQMAIQFNNKKMEAILGELSEGELIKDHKKLSEVFAGKVKNLNVKGRTYEFRLEELESAGVNQGYMLWAIDVTEHYEALKQIQEAATRDPLTRLYNRAYFQDVLQDMLKNGQDGTFFMMDMDNFKSVNDTYGHQVGDVVLNAFADVFKIDTKDLAISCRIGGDEFTAFYLGMKDEAAVRAKGEYLMTTFQKHLEAYGYPKVTSISIGACIYDKTKAKAGDFTTLYNAADKVLYEAKRQGRDQLNVTRV